jgi:hypothetical protein
VNFTRPPGVIFFTLVSNSSIDFRIVRRYAGRMTSPLTSQPLTTEATIMFAVETLDHNWLTDPEIEEMHAALAGKPVDTDEVPDEDWGFYFEAVYVDPAERPCCADRLCPCGGYRGSNLGPAPYWM